MDEQGKGIVGAEVLVEERDGASFLAAVVLEPTGEFWIHMDTDPITVRVDDPTGRYTFDQDRLVLDQKTEPPVVFVGKERASGVAELLITDGQSGESLAGVEAFTESTCGTAQPRTMRRVSDSDGIVRVPCGPDCIAAVTLHPPSGFGYLVRDWTGDVRCEKRIQVPLSRGAILTGTVVDTTGEPVQDLAVRSSRQDLSGSTDEDGRFRIHGLLPGRHVLEVGAGTAAARNLGALSAKNGEPAVVNLQAGGEKDVHLTVRPESRCCISAVDSRTGEAFIPFTARVYEPDELYPIKTANAEQDKSRRLTRLCLGGVTPGIYDVLIESRKDEYMPTWWPNAESRSEATLVDLYSGSACELEFEVRPAGAMRISEMKSDGLPSEGRITVFVAEGTDGKTEVAEGEWLRIEHAVAKWESDDLVIQPLPVGSWRVRLCAAGCGGWQWTTDEVVTIEQTSPTSSREMRGEKGVTELKRQK